MDLIDLMDLTEYGDILLIAGICILGDTKLVRRLFSALAVELGISRYFDVHVGDGATTFTLQNVLAKKWLPEFDTTHLSAALGWDSVNDDNDLKREILITMLAAPIAITYPSFNEFAAAFRIRQNIARAAQQTQLAFKTSEAERPMDYWAYDEDRGFTVLPGKSLITALKKATQPDASGNVYSFSCYRATEYVILLAIAQELTATNPKMLERLQTECEQRAIKSGNFHNVFLSEYGSIYAPIPTAYYIPGDRVWFRNPDPASSDVSGYEGSWVIYMGAGLFSNFWKRDVPFTLTTKCVEIFHWRDGVYMDRDGEPRINETEVETRVQASLNNPERVAAILKKMRRVRDPSGMYGEGGCIDASREIPRMVCPESATISI